MDDMYGSELDDYLECCRDTGDSLLHDAIYALWCGGDKLGVRMRRSYSRIATKLLDNR
jgi:hypothetical protein